MALVAEKQRKEDYIRWANSHAVTYMVDQYSSAFSGEPVREALPPLQTINPVDDTKGLPARVWDKEKKRWRRPKNVNDDNVLTKDAFLFEMDSLDVGVQREMLRELYKIGLIQRVVFSGHRSIHVKIVVEDEPNSLEEYKIAWRYMARTYFHDKRFFNLFKIDNTFPEVVDNRCGHPSRGTRTPFAIRCDEKTGNKPVEQKLLYFADIKADVPWRKAYNDIKEKIEYEQEALRRKMLARSKSYGQGLKVPHKITPNGAALRFMSGDTTDGWKYASLPSAVGSWKRCGFTLDEVLMYMKPYKENLREWAKTMYVEVYK
jgi:hypothetical protein